MKRVCHRLLLLATLVLIASAGLVLFPRSASAAVCSATIGNIDFGLARTLESGPIDGSATVTITCNSLLRATICAGIGAGSGGVAADGSRLMTSASGASLRYNLYQDPARLIPWGSQEAAGLGTTPLVTLGAGVQTATLTLYARIFGGQSTSGIASYSSIFAGAQTAFYYGELTLLSCGVSLLGSVERPTFRVDARVAANCLVEADDLNFGSRGVLNTAVTGATQLRVRCTPGTSYSVALGGTSLDAAGRRFMRPDAAGASGAVEYGLFQSPDFSQSWTATSTAGGTGDGLLCVFPVYGRVPPQPTPPRGRYTDVVIVTVTY